MYDSCILQLFGWLNIRQIFRQILGFSVKKLALKKQKNLIKKWQKIELDTSNFTQVLPLRLP